MRKIFEPKMDKIMGIEKIMQKGIWCVVVLSGVYFARVELKGGEMGRLCDTYGGRREMYKRFAC
jgi:hypothetical protein